MVSQFFHGTHVAIHEKNPPCLDPSFAKLDPETGRGIHKDDPLGPHVFLTKSLSIARLYSAGSDKLISVSVEKNYLGDRFVLLFRERPQEEALDKMSYVYTVNQDDYDEFIETEYDGKKTNRFFSRQMLDVTKYPPIEVRGLRELIQDDDVQCYYLKTAGSEAEAIKTQREAAFKNGGILGLFAHFREKITEGKMGLLNDEIPMPTRNLGNPYILKNMARLKK